MMRSAATPRVSDHEAAIADHDSVQPENAHMLLVSQAHFLQLLKLEL